MAQPKEENRLKLLDLCKRLCHPQCVGLRLRSRPGFLISWKSQKGKKTFRRPHVCICEEVFVFYIRIKRCHHLIPIPLILE